MYQEKSTEPEKHTDSPDGIPNLPPKESWLNRHSKAIIAWTAIGSFLTTFVLAIIAFFSWSEVQMQRDLAFKQFVVANAPSVRAYAKSGFQFEGDLGWMVWKAENHGGPVYDVEYKIIIMLCGIMKTVDLDSMKILIRTTNKDRLNRIEAVEIIIEVTNEETLKWLIPAFENDYGLYLYICSEYTIPVELSINGEMRRDSTYGLYGWDPHSNRFKYVKSQYEEKLLRILEAGGYFSQNDQG